MSRNSASVTPYSAGPRIGHSSSRFFSMRPSHLVIEGGQPPLLKITVWLGNKAADKYRLAPLFQTELAEPKQSGPCPGNRQDAAGNHRRIQRCSPEPCRRGDCAAQARWPHLRARWETL